MIACDEATLARVVRSAVAEALAAVAPTARRQSRLLMSASQADRLYRLAKGSAAAAFAAGIVRGERRRGASRTGTVLWIRTDDAQRAWGGAHHADLAQAEQATA